MQINISGLHLEVTDALRSYVEEKFERLSRHFDRIISVQVFLQVEDMYAAIDLLVDKLDRQLIKHKEKQLDHSQGVVAR